MEHFIDLLLTHGVPAYLLLGVAAGVAAGMLGVGGGLIIVPVLILMFRQRGFDEAVVAHLAVGTSLATIVATSISSILAHHRRGSVRWNLVGRLAPGMLIGAWLGSVIAGLLPTEALQRSYGCFAVLVGIQMLLRARAEGRWTLPGWFGMGAVGTVIGAVSAVVGIGGGTMTVPFLSACRVDMRHAVGTSSACGLPIALSGALGFVVAGWGLAALPTASMGYIYLPAGLGIVAASMFFAPLGAWLAHRLPVAVLKRIFALLLLLLGAKMLI